MSISDKDINRLTGKLLKEGMVKPSPDLSLRIMDLIMQEEPLKVPEVKKVRMSSGMPPFYDCWCHYCISRRVCRRIDAFRPTARRKR